jgi:molybdenum cofactor biosynthesis protein MoaC
MADIRSKRATRRRAVACGELIAGALAYPMIVERRLPKGDALLMAEIAGLQGAKQAANLMPLCHPLMLELVRVRCEPVPERHAIRVYCEVATEARTGVEMEALAGVSAALLTLYDLSKPVEPALQIEGIRLLFKEGGKKGLWRHPAGMSEEAEAHYQPRGVVRLDGVACAMLIVSDRASTGEYADRTGPVLTEALQRLGAQLDVSEILPDGIEPLASRLRALAGQGVRLVLCSGGTGIGPRDLTPEALASLGGREVPGIGEAFRSESAAHTQLAWLSRATAVDLQGMLVIALPGSPRAVAQGMEILMPLLAHALAMIAGEGHR